MPRPPAAASGPADAPVAAGGVRWQVERHGRGTPLLLVHGTGASSHSWRDVVPPLAPDHRVLVVDLPGHGRSSALPGARQSLPGMAAALAELLDREGWPDGAIGVGHSAGVAILARLALDQPRRFAGLVGFNAALTPLAGWLRWMTPAARLLAAAPGVPQLAAWRARDPHAVRRLIDGTGSTLDADAAARYAQLLRDPAHVAGALAMMANWNLDRLHAELPRLRLPLLLVVGGHDRTVPPAQSQRLAERLPNARLHALPGLGHLAHEEAPAAAAALVREFARATLDPVRA